MARRRGRREAPPTVEYMDADGNVLALRQALSTGTIRKVVDARAAGAATADDDWRRRTELLFERLAVSWTIAGLPLDDQSMLLGRYRMADSATQEWVRRTLSEHVRTHIPELDEALD